jgi:hypothetical protein
LEQVFLMLCIQNTEVNFVDPMRQMAANQLNLCPMCRVNPRNAVIMRVWDPRVKPSAKRLLGSVTSSVDNPMRPLSGAKATYSSSGSAELEEDMDAVAETQGLLAHGSAEQDPFPLMTVPNSICVPCALGSNKHYFLSEAQARVIMADASGEEMNAVLQAAQARAEGAKTEELLAQFELEESKLDDQGRPLTMMMAAATSTPPPQQHSSSSSPPTAGEEIPALEQTASTTAPAFARTPAGVSPHNSPTTPTPTPTPTPLQVFGQQNRDVHRQGTVKSQVFYAP